MKNQRRSLVVLFLASLPFVTKGIVLWIGITGYAAQSLYKILQLCIPVLWRRKMLHARGWNTLWPIDEMWPCREVILLAISIALVFSVSAIGAMKILAPFFSVDPALIRAGMDARFSVTPLGALCVVLFLSCINSAIEELHFRAWLDREISRAWGTTFGVSISALAFGGMHVLIFWGLPGFTLPILLLIALGLAIAGAAWSMLMRLPGGIHAAFLSHALSDALVLGWGLLWLGYF
ncbi:MAG: CPBP family glutamic-type intramembrane protease [Candidatus Peribacteraceae bacterium]|jgi:membrane protease YdiL (CAAX protease family)